MLPTSFKVTDLTFYKPVINKFRWELMHKSGPQYSIDINQNFRVSLQMKILRMMGRFI